MMYIALLRAINVGGRVVKMDRLRSIFTDLGFTNVGTFIQSGNVFFESNEQDPNAIRYKIESGLKEALGYEVPAVVRTLEQLRAAVNLDPFQGIEPGEDVRFVVIFTYDPLSMAAIDPEKAKTKGFTFLAETEGELFILMEQEPGRPGNPVAFLEKEFKLRPGMTARFFGATAKMLEAAEKHAAKGLLS